MNNFADFKQNENNNLAETIKQLLAIQETSYGDLNEALELNGETLNEGKINDLLKKSGLHLHKNKGLLSYMKDIGLGIAQIMFAAIKGDKEKIKEVMKKVSKEAVLDFLLKLDMATLHTITSPIHTIDAITGWHLWANVTKAAETTKGLVDKIKKAFVTVKDDIKNVFKSEPKRVQKYHGNLSKLEIDIVGAL